jgi:hypothetical protein
LNAETAGRGPQPAPGNPDENLFQLLRTPGALLFVRVRDEHRRCRAPPWHGGMPRLPLQQRSRLRVRESGCHDTARRISGHNELFLQRRLPHRFSEEAHEVSGEMTGASFNALAAGPRRHGMSEDDETLRPDEAIEIIRQLARDMDERGETIVNIEDITLALSVLHDEFHRERQRELLQQIGFACEALLLTPVPEGWRGSYEREVWSDWIFSACDELTE